MIAARAAVKMSVFAAIRDSAAKTGSAAASHS
jgi:hypothetical protein